MDFEKGIEALKTDPGAQKALLIYGLSLLGGFYIGYKCIGQ